MEEPTNPSPGRWLLFAEWCGIVAFGTMAVTTAVVSFEAIIYVPEPNVEFTPWHDLLGMFQLAPIGWSVIGLFGPLWIIFFGLIALLKTKKRAWHVVTAIGTVIFGLIWPSTAWGWMGV